MSRAFLILASVLLTASAVVQATAQSIATDPKAAPAGRRSDSTSNGVTVVALYDSIGSSGKGVPRVTELLGREPRVQVTKIKAEDIQQGALNRTDVVVFTGGSGSKQAGALGETARAEVKAFVERGGGYLGICAGSYLACEGFSWGLHVLDAKTVSPKWKRGVGNVQIELTDKGREIFGDRRGRLTVRYANGPILKPAGSDAIPDFEPLAFFRSELAKNDTPKGVMVNSPAIVAGHFGRGRVLCISPHPEQTEGLEDFVARAVRWLAPPTPADTAK